MPLAHWPHLVVSWGDVCVMGGACLARRGIHGRRGGMCGRRLGVHGRGVFVAGVWHPCPPVNRMTDRCKNITLPQLRCGRYKYTRCHISPMVICTDTYHNANTIGKSMALIFSLDPLQICSLPDSWKGPQCTENVPDMYYGSWYYVLFGVAMDIKVTFLPLSCRVMDN